MEQRTEQMTAVEYLFKQYELSGDISNAQWDKARRMEKEQIVNAHLTGLVYPLEMDASKQAEEYYEDNYKK